MLYRDSHVSSSVNFIGLHIYVCLGIARVRAVLPDRFSSSKINEKKKKKNTQENMKHLCTVQNIV